MKKDTVSSDRRPAGCGSVSSGGARDLPSAALVAARGEERRLLASERCWGALGLLGFLAPAVRSGVGRFVPALRPPEGWLWLEGLLVVLVLGAAVACLARRARLGARREELRRDIFTLEFLRDVLEHPASPYDVALMEHPYRDPGRPRQEWASSVLRLSAAPGVSDRRDPGGRPPLRVILGTLAEPARAAPSGAGRSRGADDDATWGA